jgi:hypothetical protein
MSEEVLWRPNPGPQTRFLALPSYEVAYGGSAGSGKSAALLMGALRFVDRPAYRALLLRRTFPELEKSLIERSFQLYPKAFPGTRYNEQKKVWVFPSGARIYFGHIERDGDVHAYQSAEFQYLGFDELTSFSERQYTYVLSRARSATGIPVRIRGATNPGGEGHDWVFRRWGPWLDPTAKDRPQPGEVLWYVNDECGERYVARDSFRVDKNTVAKYMPKSGRGRRDHRRPGRHSSGITLQEGSPSTRHLCAAFASARSSTTLRPHMSLAGDSPPDGRSNHWRTARLSLCGASADSITGTHAFCGVMGRRVLHHHTRSSRPADVSGRRQRRCRRAQRGGLRGPGHT